MKSQMSVTFSKVPARRTFEDVIAQIRAKIASGELREGDRLPPERELSSVLGVSRNTVREALRALEHSGVIEQKPGVAGGAFIRNNSTEVRIMPIMASVAVFGVQPSERSFSVTNVAG